MSGVGGPCPVPSALGREPRGTVDTVRCPGAWADGWAGVARRRRGRRGRATAAALSLSERVFPGDGGGGGLGGRMGPRPGPVYRRRDGLGRRDDGRAGGAGAAGRREGVGRPAGDRGGPGQVDAGGGGDFVARSGGTGAQWLHDSAGEGARGARAGGVRGLGVREAREALRAGARGWAGAGRLAYARGYGRGGGRGRGREAPASRRPT